MLVVSFLCSIFESVLLSLTRPQIAVMRQRGTRAGRLLEEFKDNMDVPIAAILILNTAAHTIGAAVAGASYSNVFDPSTLWLFSLIFTLAVLLFTEIIPKTMGVTFAGPLAAPVAHGIAWLTKALKPLVIVSEKMSRAIRGERGDLPVTSREEIRLLAMMGRSEGVVGPRTASMIVGATQLAELRADDIMLPREDVVFLSPDMTREQALETIRESGHSRFPFTPTGDLGEVTGIVLAKRLFHWMLTHPEAPIDWQVVVQEMLVVPATVPLPRLLRIYQESHRHLAVVVDEYGVVEGIATMEDLLEEIVGDIRDESDRPVDDIRKREDGSWVVRGHVDLRRLCAELGLVWHPDATEAATIGGLVLEHLERIPEVGDTIDWRDHRIEVVRADRKRARLVTVRKL